MPRQPTRPIFGWDNFTRAAGPHLPSVDRLPHGLQLTSGRAALWAALKVLGVQAGHTVLAPTFHCPTLIAPLRAAGAAVQFYPLGGDGLPCLDGLVPAPGTRALVAVQLFGLPRSLAATRAWCDHHGIALVEDCAHSFFGQAGERAVGHWGDVATASLTKFFPVAEAGLLASALPLAKLSLQPAGARQQIKAWVDLLERGSEHGRLAGLNRPLQALLRLKNGPPQKALAEIPTAPRTELPTEPAHEAGALASCDLGRISHAPTWLDSQLLRLPRERIVQRRRQHFQQLHDACQHLRHARPLVPALPDAAAPYAMPLWVANASQADAVYAELRAAGCAVFRWDRVWPGTPDLAGDQGQSWRHQVLQLLCHQDLSTADLAQTTQQLQRLL